MISSRLLLLEKVGRSFKLNRSLFRSARPSLYPRACSTSIPTEQKDMGDNDALIEENKALLDKYQRALAENENTKKRVQKQLEDMKSYAIQNFCKDILEISDNLDLALESAKKNAKENEQIESTSLYKGLQITRDSLQKAFAKHGLVQMVPTGEVFDPEKHDAVCQVSSESATPGDVVEVLKCGYILNGRVIRPAKLAVAPIP